MRVRTEDKRQEIIALAGELFQEFGYDRTSMSLISQRVGGSKATLYGYFRSKEELLLAVLDYDIDAQAEQIMGGYLDFPDLRKGLEKLAVAYLERRLSKRSIGFVRMVSSQPEENGVAATFHERILKPAWMRLCGKFAQVMEEGRLRRADPWTATMHWKGLAEQDLFDNRLLGAVTEVRPEIIRKAAKDSADAFLRAYGLEAEAAPEKGKRKKLGAANAKT